MKRLILTAAVLVFLACGSYLAHTSGGDEKKSSKPAKEVDNTPHRVAFVDLPYVFQNYEKLKYLLEDLQAKAQEEQSRFNQIGKKIKDEQAELKEFDEGSDEYQKRERKILQMASQAETQYKMSNRDLQKEQAKLQHTAYLEIQDVIQRFCDHYKFTVVLQIMRAEPNAADPQRLQRILSQPVVYHRKQDDLSKGVVEELNRRYLEAGGEIRSDKAAKSGKPGKPARKKEIQQAGAKDGE